MQYYKATKISTTDISTNIDASQKYYIKQTKPVTKQYRYHDIDEWFYPSWETWGCLTNAHDYDFHLK